jgi:hypothetical protein
LAIASDIFFELPVGEKVTSLTLEGNMNRLRLK